MQQVAANKSEFAALPSKIKTAFSPAINREIQFRSFLQQADPVYSQPVEPAAPLQNQANNPANQPTSGAASKRTSDALETRQAEVTSRQRQQRADTRQAELQEQQQVAKQNRESHQQEQHQVATQQRESQLQEQQQASENNQALAKGKDKLPQPSTEPKSATQSEADSVQNKADNKTADLRAGAEQSEKQDPHPAQSQDTQPPQTADSKLAQQIKDNKPEYRDNAQAQLEDTAANLQDSVEAVLSAGQAGAAPKPGDSEPAPLAAALTTEFVVTDESSVSAPELTATDAEVDWLGLLEKSHQAQLLNHSPATQPLAKQATTDLTATSIEVELANQQLELEQLDLPTAALNPDGGQPLTALPTGLESGAPDPSGAQPDPLTALLNQLKQLLDPQEGAGEQSLQGVEPATLEQTLAALVQQLSQLPAGSATASQHTELVEMEAQLTQLLQGSQSMVQLDAALLLSQLTGEANPPDTQAGAPTTLSQMVAAAVPSESPVLPTTTAATDAEIKPSEGVDPALRTLLDLPTDKLDKALANLAQRLPVMPETPLAVNEHLAGLVAQATAPELGDSKLDFVAALKAGLQEIKSQIKQGHQPAIDLSTLVTESLAQTKVAPVSTESLTQTISRFSQALELSSAMNTRVDSSQLLAGIDKPSSKESASQNLVTQQKQAQQLSQFDKAVNITRNEGVQQLTEKVRWMVSQNNLQADIRLDPPELGSMKIKVNLSGESASVNIVVQSQQAREVLEQATPRLKELLEQQGIELGQSSVQQESAEAGEQQQGQMAQGGAGDDEQVEQPEVSHEQHIRNGRLGGIDYFV